MSDNHQFYSVEVISSRKEDSSFMTHPVLISFVFPVLVTVITFFFTRLLTRKKEKTELSKIETDIEKNKVEISHIRTSFQPLVISSLQAVQNEIFKDKLNSLKELSKSKSDFFNVEQIYHEGEAFIGDTHEYAQNVYWNFTVYPVEKIKKNLLENGSLFPDSIRSEYQKLLKLIYKVYDIQKRENSNENQDMPTGVEVLLMQIAKEFDHLIDMIRKDLHLDNTFIHEFIAEHQKTKKE